MYRKFYGMSTGVDVLCKNKALTDALHYMGIVTIRDLLRCPFARLIRNTFVMNNWSDLTELLVVIHSRYQSLEKWG